MTTQSLFEEVEVGLGSSPVQPNSWSVAQVGSQGLIIILDGLQIKINGESLEKFFDLIIDEQEGQVQTETGFWLNVDANPVDGDVILQIISDSTYVSGVFPDGVILSGDLLTAIGVEVDETPVEDDITDHVSEGVKMAFKRSGKKLKRGFRVTSGLRKGRVVTNIKTAFKPRAKAATRTKMRLARRKKKAIRIMKSKRTRKKSLSKRVARMNAARG